MVVVASPADQAADLLQKLSLDSQTKTIETPDAAKKPSIDSSNMATGIQTDRSITPLMPDYMDPNGCYIPNGQPSAYYYSGFEGSEWEYTRYMNPEGADMTHGASGDNGSLIYHHGYGYAPYGPYSPTASPIPTLGHNAQLYGTQHYQYPTPYFQSVAPTSGPYPSSTTPMKGEMAASAAADQVPLSVDSTNSKSNVIANFGATKENNGIVMTRPTYQNSSFNLNGSYGRGALPGGISASGYQDPRFAYDGLHSPIPWIESPYFSDGHQMHVTNSSMTSSSGNGTNVPSSSNRHYQPHMMGLNHPRPISGMNTTMGYMNTMYPSKLYGQYGYGSSGYDTRVGGCGWMTGDTKYKPWGRGNGFYNYGNESMDGLNELNRGPRTKSLKDTSAIPDREQYNVLDFPETYLDAKFFIIKSYSEDDVHQSIKYNIWASTPNGNKKLDAAYQEAQQKSDACPVFLFFSVNTSGQFVGVAEMVGPVDFNKNVEYWQQDKWTGCFPVKWHIVKDVPNTLLKHITLEYNDNKPVTISRDTQEVKLEQGLQVLKIFKDYTSEQCILDDFEFYEDRGKKIQEKKAKHQQFQRQAQVWEGKPSEEKNKDSEENTNVQVKPRKSSDVDNKETLANCNGDILKTVPNGVANGC